MGAESWSLTWEDDVEPARHAALFARCFPARAPRSARGGVGRAPGPSCASSRATGTGRLRTSGPTRMVRDDGTVQVYGGVSMILSVRAVTGEWPVGRVDRNGLEV